MDAAVNLFKAGIDAGSTTVKIVVSDVEGNIVYKSYRRHKADVWNTLAEELRGLKNIVGDARLQVCVTGSAGMGVAERLGAEFVQEVVASVELVQAKYPETRTLLDLGGEDAKMVFFGEGKHPDIRMNGSCAGGTGAFIDQMASLLNIPVEELGTYAERHENIYPIASRCGVFAKTDIQNLISRSVPAPDIAASTLHAVALQSITSLAHGCDITPPVLCTGGPLTFSPALRDAFCKTLELRTEDLVLPENSEYFPAWGASVHIKDDFRTFGIGELVELLEQSRACDTEDSLPALFKDAADYEQWKEQRNVKPLRFREIEQGETVDCYLGIDSGSTTTKIIVIDGESNILFRFYDSNEGNSLKKVTEGLGLFYKEAAAKNATINILRSTVTGYGEDLVKSALNLDHGIVETMAHLSGAQYVDPRVSFILDIGGQDMKSMFVDGGVISNIELNEACSSGCGSFLQNFASTMNLSLEEFSHKACLSAHPADLGSRCTVFMNSKVKQSLRENAGVDDIAAGLAYSVVKNCLFKVLKISNLNKLGDHIVVQGGTFRNDAVYRTLEMLSGKSVSSTDYPELMGAFGAALYAKRQAEKDSLAVSTFAGQPALASAASAQTSDLQCKGCTNNCRILRFKFDNGNTCYAGNKCEKIFHNRATAAQPGYNAFEWKNRLLFDFPASQGSRGTVGIPRVLNMFENYPFWHTLFTGCGYDVVLSPESNFALYRKGVGSVMSDNICFPAKLAHGHVVSLIESKVDRIFYPFVPKEDKEFKTSTNSWNCPVVSGYPDVIKSSIDPEGRHGIAFDTPVINFHDDEVLMQGCWKYFSAQEVDRKQFRAAFNAAIQVRDRVRHEMKSAQQELLDKAVANGSPVFIIAGRPYHTDPLVHQKTGQILADLGATVLTDDVFREDPGHGFGNLNIVSQWSYPNRVLQSAIKVAAMPHNVQLLQLNSFGCGPDSFYMDEAASILKTAGKNLTVIRIDEIASPGSVRLRLRSLVESLRHSHKNEATAETYHGYHVPYTEADRRKTILLPWFSDFISPMLPALGDLAGYRLVNIHKPDKHSSETGLKYGNNEVCYPSTLVLGTIIDALQSGEYDLGDTVVAITQTGGQCRATNYIAQIKNGLERAGFTNIPIVALTTGKTFQNDQKAFRLPWAKMIDITVYAVLYGDAMQQMYAATSVREKTKGDTQRLFDAYMELAGDAIRRNNSRLLLDHLRQAVRDFNAITVHEREFAKIGLVGEIYVKYNNYAQAHISDWLRDQGMEVVTPPLIDFVMQYFVNSKVNREIGIKRSGRLQTMLNPAMWNYMNRKINNVEAIMAAFRYYQPSTSIFVKAESASEILSLSNQFGEGWSIAAEVAHYAHQGINRVVCAQPFGCIANHVIAKGIEKRLKSFYPDMNLLYLDIDSGIANVNLQNRLHFMIG